MARAPIPGATKTRLEASLSPEECAQLHQAFLLDILDLTCAIKNVTVFLAFTPKNQRQFFEKLFLEESLAHVVLLPQQGDNLGKRIFEAVKNVVLQGYDCVIVIGSDSPTLQTNHIKKAFETLETADACLGPSRDGGYYLIGMHKPQKKLLNGIPWGEGDVFDITLAKAQQAGLKTSILPQWYDVDTPDDLVRLRADIVKLKRIPGSFTPSRTETLLRGQFSPLGLSR